MKRSSDKTRTYTIRSFRRTSQANAERRLSVAFVASAAVHAIFLLAVGREVLLREHSSPFGQGANVLQALLVEAESQPEVVQPLLTTPDAVDAPREPQPAEVPDVVPPAPQGPSTTAPAEGSTSMGSRDPPVTITVGAVIDPTRYGAKYAKTLADLFPDPVARPPQLRSSLVLTYPRDALDTRTKARVVAILTIDELGAVAGQTLVPDDAVFGPAVADALKTAQFVPADFDGKPVRYWTILEFVFWIDGARREVGIPAKGRTDPPPGSPIQRPPPSRAQARRVTP